MKHNDAKMCPLSFRICTEFFMKTIVCKNMAINYREDVLHEIRGYAACSEDIQ